MDQNIKVAKMLVVLARELVATKYNGQIVRTGIADQPGSWKDFRGTLKWKSINATVAAKRMSLNETGDYLVTWYGGTWTSGNADKILWIEGQWNGGTFNGGKWLGGKWNGGTWNGGYDANGNWHEAGDSPDKWGTGDPSADPSNNHWIIRRILDNGTEQTVNQFKLKGTESGIEKIGIFIKRLEKVGLSFPEGSVLSEGENGSIVVKDRNGNDVFVMKRNPRG